MATKEEELARIDEFLRELAVSLVADQMAWKEQLDTLPAEIERTSYEPGRQTLIRDLGLAENGFDKAYTDIETIHMIRVRLGLSDASSD